MRVDFTWKLGSSAPVNENVSATVNEYDRMGSGPPLTVMPVLGPLRVSEPMRLLAPH